MKHDLDGTVAWVIGASSGIGAATAHELSRRGAHVVVSARRRDSLEKVSAGKFLVVPMDVTDVDSLEAGWEMVRADVGLPDLIVFSAGMWKQTPRGEFSAEDFLQHLDVHVVALARLLEKLVPSFEERGSGIITVISSVAGFRGLPGGEYYGPAKAAQINLLEALRGSLAPHGVDVITVCPGFVETDLTSENTFPMPFIVSPERAAREICDGIEKGHAEIVFPKRMRAAAGIARRVPATVWSRLATRR